MGSVALSAGEATHASRGRAATRCRSHSVHFYGDDALFLNQLSDFVGGALGAGGSCVVIATELHRRGLADRLTAYGLDLEFAARSNRYIALDARETLGRFMVEGWPDEELFRRAIEPELLRARDGLLTKGTSVVAFGEMVALLWAEGRGEAAIRLERFWNNLGGQHSFSLRCAYHMGDFGHESLEEAFRRVCAEHSEVIPSESYTSLTDEDARMRMVCDLQQKAYSLQSAVEGLEREVAQRHEVEKGLRRSEEFVKKILENSIDCVKVLDLEGRLEYMNPPGQKALEIEDMSRVLGCRWADFWKEEDRPRAEAAVEVARKGGVGSFRGDCPTIGGLQKSWDVKITPAFGCDGEIGRLVAVSRDITELKCAQRAVIQAEKLGAAGRLAATVAHEINNPLEAVTNLIFLAKTSQGLPEEVRLHLDVADRELARVAQIAQQTLGFYKDTSKVKWVNVAEVVNDVITIYDRKVRNKRLKIEVAVDAELTIFAKQGELKQTLSNLFANAIEASQDNGTVWLRAQATKNWTNGIEPGVRVTLADNGSGMTPEVQRRIFEPFFTTKTDIGTGIGLWVTKCLIEQQGGYMRFRSRQGQNAGTAMSFFIPLTSHQPTHAAT
jgi:PAS domain S-box-containing protein